MALTSFSLKDANVTVIGNFNPAILRPDFLVRECKLVDMGHPTEQSPPEIPTLSLIKYRDIWWTVELNRMIVRDVGLSGRAPYLVSKYLEALPHTPLFAAGINMFADLVISDVPVASCSLLNTASLFKILRRFQAAEIDVTVKSRLVSEVDYVATELDLKYATNHEAWVLLQLELAHAPRLRAHYNWEIRELDTDRSRLILIQEEYGKISEDFKSLTQSLLESDQDSEDKK